ncbi:MAG: pyrroloquinoline quinone biosynthesis protein PqqB [bacterium]|nr:pyrroloquinoline quinone biosynthesis protein PqqB [bacterium]
MTSTPQQSDAAQPDDDRTEGPYLVVLGIAQDGGYPQAGCRRDCCAGAWRDVTLRRGVACVAVVDPAAGRRWLIDATPDFVDQLRMLDELAPPSATPGLAGIFLTHAHMGHYTGLMHLGREAVGGRQVPVYAMPRMKHFLETNGPWDQLVRLGNIELQPLRADEPVELSPGLTVTPLLVPHRDEYSETVGYRIAGPRRRVLYIPDIDKWDRWGRPIERLIAEVDVAYLDGTFFADGEIPNRSMADVPHPFIVESMKRFESLLPTQRAKIRFIHLNHTNPALQPTSPARGQIERAGFRIAAVGKRVSL